MAITEVKSARFKPKMMHLIILRIIQVINDAFYQILTTSKFAQMVESSENIVFFQYTKKGSINYQASNNMRQTHSMPSLNLLKAPSISRYPYVKVSATRLLENIGSESGTPLNCCCFISIHKLYIKVMGADGV